MRKVLLLMAFLATIPILKAQEKPPQLAAGNIVTLGEPVGIRYRHLNFPRKNFIIKRGAIANFNALVGIKLEVIDLEVGQKGATFVTLKRKDGQHFFRFFPTVTAHLEKAVAAREIKLLRGSH